MARASIGKSLDSYASRMRAWIAFCALGITVGGVLSAEPSDMLLFVGLFRNTYSAEKYVQAVRWMYIYLERPLTYTSEKLKQVLAGGKKATVARGVRRPRHCIRWSLLKRVVQHAWDRHEYAAAAAYVTAATFLLRCRSELVNLDFSQLSFDLNVNPPIVTLTLRSRKNMPQGAQLKRKCICGSHPTLCPVHIFSRLCQATKRMMMGKVFPFTYPSFLNTYRAHLVALGVPDAQEHDTKDFRRGTAQEMIASGSSLAEVLNAGQWRSAAFLLYLDKAEVQEEAVFAAMDCLSDDEADPQATIAQLDAPPRPARAPRDPRPVPLPRKRDLAEAPVQGAPVVPAPPKRPAVSQSSEWTEDDVVKLRGLLVESRGGLPDTTLLRRWFPKIPTAIFASKVQATLAEINKE